VALRVLCELGEDPRLEGILLHPRGRLIPKTGSYLTRWKANAAARRLRVAKSLSVERVSFQRLANIKIWKQAVTSQRAWLEARLEHATEVEKILTAAIERWENSP
jgi:hypothetical protein